MSSQRSRRGASVLKEGLTFDDVLLIPGHSTVHPKDTDVSSRLTRGVEPVSYTHLTLPTNA